MCTANAQEICSSCLVFFTSWSGYLFVAFTSTYSCDSFPMSLVYLLTPREIWEPQLKNLLNNGTSGLIFPIKNPIKPKCWAEYNLSLCQVVPLLLSLLFCCCFRRFIEDRLQKPWSKVVDQSASHRILVYWIIWSAFAQMSEVWAQYSTRPHSRFS